MRFSAFIFALVATVSAHASFDLVLVADEATNSVHRFDGTSGAYLGQFGKGRLSYPQDVAVNPATGLAYVTSFATSTVQVYNYSTGLFVNEFAVGPNPRGVTMLGSDVIVSHTTGVSRYSASGGFLNNFGTGSNFTGVTVGPDGFVYAYEWPTALRRYKFDGTAAGSSAISSDTNYPHYDAVPFGNQVAFTNFSARKIEFFNANSGLVSGGSFTFTGTLSAMTGLAKGHGNALYTCGVLDSSSKPVIAQISGLTGKVGLTFGETILSAPRGMSSVVAPEPGTMIALGLGSAALLRRRKKA